MAARIHRRAECLSDPLLRNGRAGAFNFIAQEVGFPSFSSFKPRFSIAGKLSGR